MVFYNLFYILLYTALKTSYLAFEAKMKAHFFFFLNHTCSVFSHGTLEMKSLAYANTLFPKVVSYSAIIMLFGVR